jgi:RNA 2',3'-cyclic 3'-phosphodiesterase
MRLFIAVGLADDVRQRLSVVQEKIVACGQIRAVEYVNLHITLKFLGEADGRMMERVSDALGKIQHSRIPLRIKGLGAFPSTGGARVIWAGVADGFDETYQLHTLIDAALLPLGFERDPKFHPHVTLARVKGKPDKKMIWDILEAEAQTEFGSQVASEILLMESSLSNKGPIYRKLMGFPLV